MPRGVSGGAEAHFDLVKSVIKFEIEDNAGHLGEESRAYTFAQIDRALNELEGELTAELLAVARKDLAQMRREAVRES